MQNLVQYGYVFLVICWSTKALQPHKRFEYKHSFKGPNLVQRDASIPFWDKGGSAIASDEFVRITPSLRSKRGYIWNRNRVLDKSWEVEITFKVAGRGRVGADGLAFWYTGDRILEGPVFGGPDKWRGIAVFLDSFDNDNQHNNPYIMGMLNDGTASYNHDTDGGSQQLGGCMRDYRNKPYPSKLKIEYYQHTLTVFYKNGLVAPTDQDYELCFRAEQVDLPEKGYFGLTAATGGLADDHDVLSVLTYSLTPPDDSSVPAGGTVSDEDRQKFQKEFDEYKQKLEEARKEYKRKHPEAEALDEDKDVFEGREIQELKMIFEGQSQMHHTMRELHRKFDELIGRQERASQQISQLQSLVQDGRYQQQPGGGQAQLPSGSGSSIQRHEVDQIVNSQRDVQQNVKDIRSFVNDIQSKIHNLNQQGGGTGGQSNTEIKNILSSLQTEVRNLANKQAQGCPSPVVNCVTMTSLVVVMVIQVALYFAYSYYKNSKDAAAKKFY